MRLNWNRFLPPLCLAGLIYFAAAARFYDHTVDDAFISYRYARNLVEGHGLVFNPGERVEGYTNFLWVLLISGGIRAGLEAELLGRLLGLISGFGLLTGVAYFSVRWIQSRALAWISPLIVATHPALAVWSTAGLETPLFACLVLWAVGLAVEASHQGRLSYASALLFAIASLTRPEGPALAFLALGVWMLTHPPARAWRGALPWIGLFAGIVLPYFFWRFLYYGYLLPNTFYAKVDPGGSQIARGLAYTHVFWKATGYWLIVPISGLVYPEIRKRGLQLLAPLMFFTAYIMYVGGDGLPMMRFFVPILGLLILASTWGADQWLRTLNAGKVGTACALVFFALAWGYSVRANFGGNSYEYVMQDRREVAAWTEIGLWFRENADPEESIAVIPAGAMPYFSRLKTIDMLGLNDATIARSKGEESGKGQAGHERHNAEYVLEREPTYVVIGVYQLAKSPIPDTRWLQLFYPAETALAASSEFGMNYIPVQAKTSSGYFLFYRRVRT